MSGILVAVPTSRFDGDEGVFFTIDDDSDVTRLLELIRQPWSYPALIEFHGSPRFSARIYFSNGYGYISYDGPEGLFVSVGDDQSSLVDLEVEFPAGSGLGDDQFNKAVREMMKKHGLPSCVKWHDVHAEIEEIITNLEPYEEDEDEVLEVFSSFPSDQNLDSNFQDSFTKDEEV